jgi:hypothetical protein
MHFLYQTTNLVNNKIYIGIHTTDNINDGYLGSSLLLKQDIKLFGVEKFKREILEYFDTIEEALKAERKFVDKDFIKRQDTYNRSTGGRGGWHRLNPKETATVKDKDGNYYRVPKNDPRIISGELVGVTKGKTLTKDHRIKISKNGKGKKHCMTSALSDYAKNVCFINKDGICRKIPKTELQNYIDLGWSAGRTK